MSRPKREVDPELVKAWGELRAEAAAGFDALLAAGPDPTVDLLGHLAWRSGTPEPEPFDVVRVRLVVEAIAARYSWREVALALGFDEADEKRCLSMYTYRIGTLKP